MTLEDEAWRQQSWCPDHRAQRVAGVLNRTKYGSEGAVRANVMLACGHTNTIITTAENLARMVAR